jgi:2-phospho-L-lactate guanylyltransferase
VIWALVPVKDFSRAKKRLSPALGPLERAALAEALARRAIAAARACRGIDEVVVLSNDHAAAAWARSVEGVCSLSCHPDRDLAQVVDHGLYAAARGDVHQALVLMGDLPRVTTADLDALLRHGAPVAVPDHHGTGTNALFVDLPAPPTALGFPDSLLSHKETWPELAILELPGIALDIDLPRDLRRLGTEERQTLVAG